MRSLSYYFFEKDCFFRRVREGGDKTMRDGNRSSVPRSFVLCTSTAHQVVENAADEMFEFDYVSMVGAVIASIDLCASMIDVMLVC